MLLTHTSAAHTVVCAALNFRGTLAAREAEFHQDPYKQPPRAPVLYLKPPSTHVYGGNGHTTYLACPPGAAAVQVAATVGVMIGRAASRLRPADAHRFIAGYVPVIDLSLPHTSFYRPALRQRCFDQSLVTGDMVPAERIADPNQIAIRTTVNGAVTENSTANLVRPVEQLLADVTEFMTLTEGTLLCVGEPDNSPLARPGDHVTVELAGLGRFDCQFAPSGAAR